MKRLYELVATVCQSAGVDAYVPHLHSDPEKHADMPASEVYRVDTEQVIARDLLIVEATYPSHGVGGEVVHAHYKGIPIWLLHKVDVHVSRYLRGVPNITIFPYKDEAELKLLLSMYLIRADTPKGIRQNHA
jgi:hypothetical protein